MDRYYALIAAGGHGTRLWPMSRAKTPKQMLPLINQESMFRTSVERIQSIFPPEDIFVVTGRELVDDLRDEVPQLPSENFIVEPYAKNTAPALALALATIQKRDPDATVAIFDSRPPHRAAAEILPSAGIRLAGRAGRLYRHLGHRAVLSRHRIRIH